MIAARLMMLFVAASLTLVASGATAPDLQPGALRVMAGAAVGLLAPLFWPGLAATPARTAMRIAAWSAAAAVLAAMAMRVFGHPARAFVPDLRVCGMLWLMLVLAHAAAAAIEAWLRGRSVNAQGARELAGHTVVAALAAFGSLPLWLGPAGELLSARHDGAVDVVLALSPLVHLAVAADNDLLRNDWFYQHSSLAGLQYGYPGLVGTVLSYAAACALLALAALAWRPPRRRHPPH